MINRVSQADFQALCTFVTEKIKAENGKPVVIVIADEACNIIHMMHMDGVPGRSGVIASGKAFSAAKMERTTTALGELCTNSCWSLSLFNIDGLTSMPGGTPLFNKEGEFIGAVGVSGRSAVEDQAMADCCAEFIKGL